MSIKKLTDPKKVTINLTRRTVEKFKDFYPTVGYQAAMRAVLDKHVADIEAKRAGAVAKLDIDVGEVE